MSTDLPDPARVPPIVDPSWLRDRFAADSTVTVCHVRSTMAGSEPLPDRRHLPGTRFVSLDDDLAAPPSGTAGRHPLPTPADFAASLGRLGIDDEATVVAYDDRGGAFASRLVWMLRILGRRATLLDGGIGELLDGAADPEPGSVSIPAAGRTVHDWPADALADADRVRTHIQSGGVVIDSRDPARYAGETEPIDHVAGHVPGAVNVPFTGNLAAGGGFRTVDELHARFAPVIGDDTRTIVYCGSGVTACHNALAMEHAGLGLPRVYVGSWSGWSADPEHPIATGPTP